MGIDVELLRELCGKTLERTDLSGLGERIEGKVRDAYRQDGRRVLVTSDRVSCFDVVVGTIPLKGQVLNQLAAFWFERTKEIAPNHLIEVPDPNVAVVREDAIVPDMTAAFSWFGERFREERESAIIATGPSATADMGELVLGAHGPKDVHVVVVR